MKLLDLQAQYSAYQDEIDVAVQKIIASGHFIGGPAIAELERGLCEYCQAPYAITCSSGTDALLLSLMALGVGPGDEVITTPYSFIATAEVIILLRAHPVFVDVDPHTFNIDAKMVAGKITEKTRTVIPVSLFGEVPDMETINAICHDKGIPVLEDAAQSFGASSLQGKSGNLSTLAATSFFPAKPLGGYGDGGAIFTQDNKLAKKIRMLLNHGQSRQYYNDYIGINGRLDALQAAVISVKLKHLDQELEKRNHIACFYQENIDPEFFIPQKVNPNNRSTYAQYCVVINNSGSNLIQMRQKIRNELAEKGIPTAVYYPVPIHLQKPFQKLGYRQGDFPISEQLSDSMMALPIHPFLNEDEMRSVVNEINEIGRKYL